MLLLGMFSIEQEFFLLFIQIHFSRFSKKHDAEDALDRMDGTDLDGREIRVQFARYGRASTSGSREKGRHER